MKLRGAFDTGDTTITGSLYISGSAAQELTILGNALITGSLIVSGSGGGGVFSKTVTIADEASMSFSASYKAWRAPFPCSVVAVYGIRQKGGAAQVNAFRSSSAGISAHVSTNITLTNADLWTAGSIQNTDYVAGDTLLVHLSASAGNTQLTCQVDYVRK